MGKCGNMFVAEMMVFARLPPSYIKLCLMWGGGPRSGGRRAASRYSLA